MSSRWSRLVHSSSQPNGTSIKFRTRTADTEAGLANALWSDHLITSGTAITSPDARWIEIEATLSTTNSNVTPLLHDLTLTYDSDPGQVLWETDVPLHLAAGAVSDLSNLIGTLGVTGKLYLQGKMTSSTGQTVAISQYPFYIEQAAISAPLATDKDLYRPGETLTINGEVRNRSSVAAEGLTLQVVDPGAAGEVLYTETFDLTARDSRPFTFTTVAGADGLHALVAKVVQNGVALAEDSAQYEVASPTVQAALAAPDTAGAEPFAITLTLSNTGKIDAAASVQVTDDSGKLVGTDEIVVPAGETRLVQYFQQISRDTVITTQIGGDLVQTLIHPIAYVALPADTTVIGWIVTDKISYNPNESATLTATITTPSAQENLSALLTVTDAQGQVLYSATTAIPSLVAGQTLAISRSWNVGTQPVGTYPVTLQVFDAADLVRARANCSLVVNSVTSPRVLLNGVIVLDKQSVLAGEPITASYGVTNVGNIDLANVDLRLLAVRVDDEVVQGTHADQAALAMGATHAGSKPLDTQAYSAGDYLMVLQAMIDGVEEALAGTGFRVEGAPTAPALAAPALEAGVNTSNVLLVVTNSSDPNHDRLTYTFEVYEDATLATRVAEGMVAETQTLTRWTVPAALAEGHTYFWRVRAFDGKLYGPWMPTASFWIIDETPPELSVMTPVVGEVYRTGVPIAVQAIDLATGIAAVAYRLDDGEWISMPLADADRYAAMWETTYADDGSHTVSVRATDGAGNQAVSAPIPFEVLSGATPPVTNLIIGEPHYTDEAGVVYVRESTSLSFSATDDISGVQATSYRFDEETDWRTYSGAFDLAGLDFGPHTVHFRSIDYAGNQEEEKTRDMTLIGIDVDAEILNVPRVLVWIQDSAQNKGKSGPAYTQEEIGDFLSGAFAGQEAYVQVVTEKEAFRSAFRSGIYNVVMILDQDVPFDAGFLREMREAVYQGTGLLVSNWGNSVHPIMQEMLGVDFRGSLPMDEAERTLLLYDSPLSANQTLVAQGRVLKTALAGGTLAGIIPGESVCAGIESLTLNYPLAIRQGDRVAASLSIPKGKQLVLIDEEQLTVDTLPAVPPNNSGPPDGDITIAGITADGISLALSAPYGYLGESYSLSVRVERADGTLLAIGPVPIAPTCTAILRPGATVGPFLVGAVNEDRRHASEDTPAVVLSKYGEGRAVFLAYDLVGSSVSDAPGHAALLRNAANWLLPPISEPYAGKIALLQTTIRSHGAALELKAEEVLGEGMSHRPLFGLTQPITESRFSLIADEEVSYRYFVELNEEKDEYSKMTRIFLRLDGDYPWFDDFPFRFKTDGGLTPFSP